MALITSVASGHWNDAGTWDAGVPNPGTSTVLVNTAHVVDLETDITSAGSIEVKGTLRPITNGLTLTAAVGIVLAGGTLGGEVGGGSQFDIDTTTISGSGTIDWGNGQLDVLGTIDGTAITHLYVTISNLLIQNTAGATLNLTEAVPALSIEVLANTTIPATGLSCYGFSRGAGTVTMTGIPTITVRDGGFSYETARPTGNYNLTFDAAGSLATASATSETNRRINILTANADITLDLPNGCSSLAGTGSILCGDYTLIIYALADGWLANFTGTIDCGDFDTTGKVFIRLQDGIDADPQGDLTITNLTGGDTVGSGRVIFIGTLTADNTMTFTGNIQAVGGFQIAPGFAKSTTLNMAKGKSLNSGIDAIYFGESAAGDVVLSTDGVVKTAGGLATFSAASATWNMGSSYIETSGTFNGTDGAINITLNSTADDTVMIQGIEVGGVLPDIAGCTFTNKVHAFNCTDDIGGATPNTKVDFDKYATVGSGALMGCGV